MKLKSIRNRIDVLYPKYSYMNNELTKQLNNLHKRSHAIISLNDLDKLQYKEILKSIALRERDNEVVSAIATHGWKNVHMERYEESPEDVLDNIINYTATFATFVSHQILYKRGVNYDDNFVLPLAIEYYDGIADVYVYDPATPDEELPFWDDDERVNIIGVFLVPKKDKNYKTISKRDKESIKNFQAHIQCSFGKRDRNRVFITKKGYATIDIPLRRLMEFMESSHKF